LATRRGLEVIAADPARFAAKVYGEARKLVALEYWDYMREHPAIWAPPAEVWLRLLLGDGMWLALAVLGGIGLWLLPARLRWLWWPWALYVVLTNLLFHVELRYRLPLYPVLAVAAAITLSELWGRKRIRGGQLAGAGLTAGAILLLMALHRPYLREGAMLAVKHWALWHGDGATALRVDPDSALARVALARTKLGACPTQKVPCDEAERWLREAIAAKSGHPYAHLLLGMLLRDRGQPDDARPELQYETRSLQDLQRWAVDVYGPRGAGRVDLGDGLDLGDIAGFHAAENGYRWTTERASVWLQAPDKPATLRLRVASGRPPGSGPVGLTVSTGGRQVSEAALGSEWTVVEIPLEQGTAQREWLMQVDLAARVFRPRELDRANNDNRALGVKLDWIELVEG